MARTDAARSYVPWWLERSDLNEANGGDPEFTRDLQVNGHAEKHFGLVVTGQINWSVVLGMIAIRCEREGTTMRPISLSIPDTPPGLTRPVPAEAPFAAFPQQTYQPYSIGVRYRRRADAWKEENDANEDDEA